MEQRRLFDINAKLVIAKQIVYICEEHKFQKDVIHNYIIRKGSQFFPSEYLKDIVANIHKMSTTSSPKTFSRWIKHSSLKRDLYLIENNAIDKLSRDIIVDHYVRKRTLLSKDEFINKLKNIAYQRSLDIEVFMQTRGYKSKQLPNSAESIIIEDPELRFARMKYLQSIEQNRKAGMHIVYIDTKVANCNGHFVEKIKLKNNTAKVLTIFQRAVSPVMGVLSKKIRKLEIYSNLDTYDDLYCSLMNWIIETVAPQISTPSVFVIEDNILYGKTHNGDAPTMYSSKKEMLNWLQVNDIPHCKNMHSAELFELIKKSNRNLFKKKYVLDETLMSYGHKILRRPRGTNYLDYFDELWEKATYKPLFEKLCLFNQTSLENWKRMDGALSEIEQNVLKEDLAVNNSIEKLLTYAKYEQIPHHGEQILYRDIDEFKLEEIVKII